MKVIHVLCFKKKLELVISITHIQEKKKRAGVMVNAFNPSRGKWISVSSMRT